MTIATTTVAPPLDERHGSGRLVALVHNVVVLTRRNLIHIAREPMQLSDVTIQPVLFTLLFIWVLGSGVQIPGGYKEFAIAGLLLLNLTTSSMGSAVGLATDLSTGVIDRFRALPMWRAAVLVGRSIADLITAVVRGCGRARHGLCHGLAAACVCRLGAGGFAAPPLVHLRALVGLCLPWNRLQRTRKRSLSGTHRPVPTCHRFERDGAHSTHAGVAAPGGRLESGERGHRRSPAPIGQPEPICFDTCLADATSRGRRPDLVGGDHCVLCSARGLSVPPTDHGLIGTIVPIGYHGYLTTR